MHDSLKLKGEGGMDLILLQQVAFFAPLILGAYLSFELMKIPSLSIESAYVCGAIFASQIFKFFPESSIWLLCAAVLASFFGGAIVGIVASWFSQKAKFSHLLSAIITIGLFHGVVEWLVGDKEIFLSEANNPLNLCSHIIPQYPAFIVVFTLSILVGIVFFIFLKTQLGVSCAIYGDNPLFLKTYRINQAYVVTSGMALSNGLVGLSGYLVSQHLGRIDAHVGVGIPLLCISALVIGKSIWFSKKNLQLMTPLLGILGYFIIQNILLDVGFSLRYFTMVQACIVALLLFFVARLRTGSWYKDLLGV